MPFHSVSMLQSKHFLAIPSQHPHSEIQNVNKTSKVDTWASIYSRSFILTYHFAILGFIFILSVVHWSEKAIRCRKRRAARLQISGTDKGTIKEIPRKETKPIQDYEGASSSGTSTIEGTTSHLRKIDEATPLLHSGRSARSLHSRETAISSMNAFLIYQRRPIPFFNKILPSNGTSIDAIHRLEYL